MKTLLFTLSLFAVISCTAQDRECHWSDRYVDSLKSVIETKDAEILSKSFLLKTAEGILEKAYVYIDSAILTIKTQDAQINQQSIFIGVQGLRISELTQDNDSLINVTESYLHVIQALTNPKDTLLYLNDTISVSFLSDSIRLDIAKIGDRFNYQLTDGLHRLNIWYYDKKFTQLLMYDKASYDSEITTFAIPVK